MRVARHVVDAPARAFARDSKACAIEVVTPAVRQADHAWAYGIGHFDGHDDRARLRSESCEIAVGKTSRPGISRMDEQRTSPWALHEAPGVVHPGVVVAKLAASDQQKLARHITVRAGVLEELLSSLVKE